MSIALLFSVSQASGGYTEDDTGLYYPSDVSEPPEPLLEPYPSLSPQTPHTFFFESIMLFLIAIFLFNMYLGKKKNERLAAGWLYLLKPLFSENFSHTGVAENEGEGEML